jgi:hypothetical protein
VNGKGKTAGKTGKKLQNNGLWESSRMMLPEHKEAITKHRESLLFRKTRPELDEAETERIARLIAASMATGCEAEWIIYRDFAETRRTGRVVWADPLTGQVRIAVPGGFEQVHVKDIIGAEECDI